MPKSIELGAASATNQGCMGDAMLNSSLARVDRATKSLINGVALDLVLK